MMQIKAENCKNCNLKLQGNIYSFKMTLFNEINILGPQDFFLTTFIAVESYSGIFCGLNMAKF